MSFIFSILNSILDKYVPQWMREDAFNGDGANVDFRKKLRAELSSNASALELRSDGLTPQNLHAGNSHQMAVLTGGHLRESCRADGVLDWRWLRGALYVAGILGLQVFFVFMATDALKFASAPGTPRWRSMACFSSCCTPYIRCCPFFPEQPQSTELPATTEGRWRRRHLSPGQGRTVDCSFNVYRVCVSSRNKSATF